MTSTTYSNRSRREFKETYFWALKKSRGMLVLLALLMFIALPMILMIGMSNASHNTHITITAGTLTKSYLQYFSVLTIISIPIVLTFVVITAASQFNYLHQKRSIDLFHSLPVRRTPMLLGRYCAALTAIFVPILFNFIIVSVIGLAYGISASLSFGTVMIQMLWMLLMVAASLTFSVFMAVCTGTTFDMVISILGINIAYPLLVFLSSVLAGQILPGLNIDLSPSSTVLTAFSPFAAAFFLFINTNHTSGQNITSLIDVSSVFPIWWIVLTLVMLAASILLYRKRRSECAESDFAFPIPKIAIRFIITAVAGIGFGLLLLSTTNMPSNFFIGTVSGSLAAHIVVEAVYSRGFQHMKRNFVWYGFFAAAFLIFYGVLATGFFGYDTRLPNAEQIESIHVVLPNEYSNPRILNENYRELEKLSPILKDKENIDKVLALHKELVETNRKSAYPYSINNIDHSLLTLTYQLKNGTVFQRSYRYYSDDTKSSKAQIELETMTSQIKQIEEYRETSNILFYLEPEYIRSFNIIDINKTSESNETPVMPDANAKKELLEAMKQDYLSGAINDSDNSQEVSLGITLEYEDPTTLKDGKLKALLGGYDGKIVIEGSNNFTLTNKAEKTKELIRKYDWGKSSHVS